jgi:hypothetical protein
MAHDIQAVRGVLKQTRGRLLDLAQVVATGVGIKVTAGRPTGELSIVCSVTRKRPLAELAERDRVPASLDGIATDVVETGVLRSLQSRTARHRPAPGGVSIGHRDITAGTLGCLVRRNGETVILSNNHVLANSNAATRGDPILQPGAHDGGTLANDRIADLLDFVVIDFVDSPSDCAIGNAAAGLLNAVAGLIGSTTRLRAVRPRAGENRVDAAIARPLNPVDVSPEILEVGRIQGMTSGALGMAVKKSGRTTGFTRGTIDQIDVTANVQYGPGQIARFTDQLLAGPMSQGGDSGSAVLDNDNRLVGLLFAGSDNTTIINRIEHVFAELGLTL